MSTVAIITDTHFGARNDLVPLQRSQAKFFERVFFPTLADHGVKQVFHGGDYTDKREKISYATAQAAFQMYRMPMRLASLRETIIVGNHDCYYKHSNFVNSINELYRDDPMVVPATSPIEIDVDGSGMLLLPWICEENREASLHAIADSKCALVLGHLELAGFQMYQGQVNNEGMDAALFDKFKLVMSGHFHHRSNRGPIHYLGAPYAMTWGDYRDPRGFHLFDTQTHQLTFIENPYTIFNRIVYDDLDKKHAYINDICHTIIAPDSVYRESYVKVVVKNKKQPYWFDLMMDSLYKVNALDVVVVDDIVVNATDDDTPVNIVDTVTLMDEYVDSLDINCEKDELKKYLRTLYTEAISANQSARLS